MKTKLIEAIRNILPRSFKNCEMCQAEVKDIVAKLKNSRKPIEIRFNPDTNANGLVTHWHIELIRSER